MSDQIRYEKPILVLLTLLTFCVYLFSNPLDGSYYDYTLRIAGALLDGRLGLEERPPDWLNEIIPLDGRFYSAFPLGGVLTMIPLAVLKKLGVIAGFHGVFLAALLASVLSALFFLISAKYDDGLRRRIILTLFPIFGTWMWANLAFGGAWHIALGVAVAGQLAALYFTIMRPNPMAAGFFFALAFGNRTEIILTAPIFFYLFHRTVDRRASRFEAIARFIVFPLALGIATMGYNYARFSSVFDFGYARIPGVLDEPWYRNGIFSISAIPGNAGTMLFETWKRIDHFPYLTPDGFGDSIFLSCPYLIFLFRKGSRDKTLKRVSWMAIAILTSVLWLHGNTGGWQVSYRYAMELLPWMFLIMLESGGGKVSVLEIALLIISIAINAFATYLFLWTDYIKI